VNLLLFMKAYARIRAQAAIVAKEAIRDDSIRFALVKEDGQASDGVEGGGKFSSELSEP
jgi:hypothetical protein